MLIHDDNDNRSRRLLLLLEQQCWNYCGNHATDLYLTFFRHKIKQLILMRVRISSSLLSLLALRGWPRQVLYLRVPPPRVWQIDTLRTYWHATLIRLGINTYENSWSTARRGEARRQKNITKVYSFSTVAVFSITVAKKSRLLNRAQCTLVVFTNLKANRIKGYQFSSRLTATLNLCSIYLELHLHVL